MNSPYEKDWRLQDVIAAIQVMGAHDYDKLTIEKWTFHKLPEKPKSASNWQDVFSEHPEFFTVSESEGRASLTWRRAYNRNFDVETRRELTTVQIAALPREQEDLLSRKPLDSSQIQSLITTAISLHTSALAQQEEYRKQQESLRAEQEELRKQQESLRAEQKELREKRQASFWWIPLLAAILSFIGAILGVLLKQ